LSDAEHSSSQRRGQLEGIDNLPNLGVLASIPKLDALISEIMTREVARASDPESAANIFSRYFTSMNARAYLRLP